jgi:hypothetical protein
MLTMLWVPRRKILQRHARMHFTTSYVHRLVPMTQRWQLKATTARLRVCCRLHVLIRHMMFVRQEASRPAHKMRRRVGKQQACQNVRVSSLKHAKTLLWQLYKC